MNDMNNELNNLVDFKHLLYESGYLDNPFEPGKRNKILFADDTASGRPCKPADQYICDYVAPYMNNTHSNSSSGIMMKNMIEDVKKYMRDVMNISSNKKIIFTGSGSTGAINLLVNKIKYENYKHVYIYLTNYEHHANYLVWIEKAKIYNNIQINFIEGNNDFKLDLSSTFVSIENNYNEHENNLFLISITGGSNVTGIKYLEEINMIRDFIDQKNLKKTYLISDFACISPYVDIDSSKVDAMVMSPHKFVGCSSVGILIADEKLFEDEKPFMTGGGCVNKVNGCNIEYKENIEFRETAGTPPIVQIIKFGYVLKLKQSIIRDIESNEKAINKFVLKKMNEYESKYPSFKVVGLKGKKEDDLPIFSFIIGNVHYNLITALFDHLYGIETRGGLSCTAGILKIFQQSCGLNEHGLNASGWCRISFSYLFNKEDVLYILDALEYIIINAESYYDKYIYDAKANLFMLKDKN